MFAEHGRKSQLMNQSGFTNVFGLANFKFKNEIRFFSSSVDLKCDLKCDN